MCYVFADINKGDNANFRKKKKTRAAKQTGRKGNMTETKPEQDSDRELASTSDPLHRPNEPPSNTHLSLSSSLYSAATTTRVRRSRPLDKCWIKMSLGAKPSTTACRLNELPEHSDVSVQTFKNGEEIKGITTKRSKAQVV